MKIGTGVSPGIVFGKAFIYKEQEEHIEKKIINDIEEEKVRFTRSVKESKTQILNIKANASNELDTNELAIFDTHVMLIEDPEIILTTLDKIESKGINAEYAFKEVIDQFISIFKDIDDEYMRERAADLRDVSGRVLRNLLGIKEVDISVFNEEVILVAEDLTPSETVVMDKKNILGFLTDIGGRTSHTAIMARSLEIPAVVGLKNITKILNDGDYIAFNGETGEVIINPDEEKIKVYQELKDKYDKKKNELEALIGQESMTKDGRKVELVGNIGTPNDIEVLEKNDAEGVGLYRTEFIYMDRHSLPTEEEQFEAYKKVLSAMDSKPVVIRTLDIGGDKNVSYLDIDKEENPFLGYRAIRLCLDRIDIFETQLRALLRASVYGNLKIMFPMISSLKELLKAKDILERVKEDLDKDSIKYASNIEVGMMIEVPSAALISDVLAKHVDFFSIGTNDLIQYTTAVDRMNQKIDYLYNQFNPAILRLIKIVIENGHREGIWVGMCGEMAGDMRMIPLLLGLGLDEFSMSSISILPARELIRSLSFEEMKSTTTKVLEMSTEIEIEEFITSYINKY